MLLLLSFTKSVRFGKATLSELIKAEEKNVRERNALIVKQEQELEKIKNDSKTIENINVDSHLYQDAFKRKMDNKINRDRTLKFIQAEKEIERSINKSKIFTEDILPLASSNVRAHYEAGKEQTKAEQQVTQRIKSVMIEDIIYNLATETIGKKKDATIPEMQEVQKQYKALSFNRYFQEAINQTITPEVIKQMKEATNKEECDNIYSSLTKQIKEKADQIKGQEASAGQLDKKDPQRQLSVLSTTTTKLKASLSKAPAEVDHEQEGVKVKDASLEKAKKQESSTKEKGKKENEGRFWKGVKWVGKNVLARPVSTALGAGLGCLKGAYQGVRGGDGFIDSCAGLVGGAIKGTIQGARDGFYFDAKGMASGNYAVESLRGGDYDKDADRSSQNKENSKNGIKWGLLLGVIAFIVLPFPINFVALIACAVTGKELGERQENPEYHLRNGKRPTETPPQKTEEPSKEQLESMVTTVREIEKDKQTKEEIQKTAERLVEKAIENPEEFSKMFKEEAEKLAEQIRERRAQEAAQAAIKSSARLVGPVEEVSPERSAGPSPSPAPRGQNPDTKAKDDNKGKPAGAHSAKVLSQKKDDPGKDRER